MQQSAMNQDAQQGFSMVDMMISLVVSMVLIGALLSVVHQQGATRRSTEEGILALSAARKKGSAVSKRSDI